MELTKFEFLNKIWIEAEHGNYISGYFNGDKEKVKEKVISMARHIENILIKEFEAPDRFSFFNWTFDRLWIELKWELKFEEFINKYNEKIKTSFDPIRMIKEELEFRLSHKLGGFRSTSKDQDWCENRGYHIAIKGENPPLKDLISINKVLQSSLNIEFSAIDNLLSQRTLYFQIISRSHFLCYGYLRAKEEYYLKNLLKDLETNQNLNGSSPATAEKKQKITWRGELKEFAELIDSLEKKGWITINDGELRPTVKSICEIFDFTATKKKADSNTENSLMQILKPSERENKIYTKKYVQKFSSIKSNSNL